MVSFTVAIYARVLLQAPALDSRAVHDHVLLGWKTLAWKSIL